MSSERFRLTGLIAAPFTPFDARGALNPALVPRLAAHLRATGVHGAFICGTTGEWPSLTIEERRQLAACWRRHTGDGLPLIVHVAHPCLEDSQALARHAQEIGADAIALLAPNFFRPEGLEGLVDWCAEVGAAAPQLPLYYYHMPVMTGVNGSMAEFLPLAARRIPNFGGIKFTHENLMDYALTLEAAGDRHDVLFGRDEILLAGWSLGARGAVGSTYNFAAPIYRRMIAACDSGDQAAARSHQMLATRMIAAAVRNGGLPALKAMMGMIGLDCGPMRPPFRALTAAQHSALRHELDALDFFTMVRAA